MAARKALVSLGVAAVVAGAAAGLAAAQGERASCAAPDLRLADSDPVTIKGTGFCARERLRVRARVGDSVRSRRLRADDDGSFRAHFGALDYDPCTSSLSASARSGGDVRASLKRPRKRCPVPLQPPA